MADATQLYCSAGGLHQADCRKIVENVIISSARCDVLLRGNVGEGAGDIGNGICGSFDVSACRLVTLLEIMLVFHISLPMACTDI